MFLQLEVVKTWFFFRKLREAEALRGLNLKINQVFNTLKTFKLANEQWPKPQLNLSFLCKIKSETFDIFVSVLLLITAYNFVRRYQK
jgi:hypothetical protein